MERWSTTALLELATPGFRDSSSAEPAGADDHTSIAEVRLRPCIFGACSLVSAACCTCTGLVPQAQTEAFSR